MSNVLNESMSLIEKGGNVSSSQRFDNLPLGNDDDNIDDEVINDPCSKIRNKENSNSSPIKSSATKPIIAEKGNYIKRMLDKSMSFIEERGNVSPSNTSSSNTSSGRASTVSLIYHTSAIQRDGSGVLETDRILLYNNNSNNTSNNKENIRDIMEFSKLKLLQRMHNELLDFTERKWLYFGILFTIISGIIRIIFFSFIGSIVDLLGNTYDYDARIGHRIVCGLHEFINCSTDKSLVSVFIVALIILSIISSLSKLFQSLLTTLCCNSFIKRLNYLVFDKIISSDLSLFDCRKNRDLQSLLTSDMKHITKTLYSTENIIESLVYFICCIIYLLIFNWDTALIIISSFVISVIVSRIYHKKAVKIYENMDKSFKVSVITLTEMLNYITTIKTFDKEDDEEFLFQQCINRAFKFDKNRNVLLYCYRFWVTIITYLTILCVVWYGTVASHISIGQLMTNLFVLLQLNYCIFNIIKLSNKIYPESVRRIINILDIRENKRRDEIEEKQGNDDEDVEGLIIMKNIEFSYPSSPKLVLNNVSLSFNASSTTALVGMPGSGKSSILQLIMKFYSPQNGRIFINDMDINKCNLDFLHSQIGYIGYIGKEIHLFENRTIADNIKFGLRLNKKNHDISEQRDIENAAKIANAHEFIMKLENGYNTIIGGINGIKLKQGEKQRIGIARTILLKPKILLLNEAMSHLDSISKHLIQESLDKIMYGRCVIVIAHRLKTVKRANKIYVIHNGKVVQSGNHNELIQIKDGQYFKLNQKEVFN